MTENKDFFKKAFSNMKEEAGKQKKIDRENFNVVKADSKSRFEEAKKADPDFEEFKNAKGLKGKLNTLLSHAERNSKEVRQENRKEYEEMLRDMRAHINENFDEKNK